MRALAVVAVLAAPAFADPLGVPEKAHDLADRGRALYDAGDYTGAIAAYDEAYALAPRPGLLFNLAQAYRLSGDCDDAAFMYRRFLESAPIEPARRTLAEANLALATRCGHGGLVLARPRTPAVIDSDVIARSRLREAGAFVAAGGVAALAASGVLAWDAAEAPANNHGTQIAEACGVIGGAALVSGAILFAIGYRREVRHIAIAPSARGGTIRAAWSF